MENHSKSPLHRWVVNIQTNHHRKRVTSDLLPCIAPLINVLKNSSYGYESQNGKLTHLFYMADRKIFAKDHNQQIGLFIIVKTFSDDIRMEFGLDTCAKATLRRRWQTKTTDVDLEIDTIIKEWDQEGINK